MDGRGQRCEVQTLRERLRLVRHVPRAVVAEPFDRVGRQRVAEARLDRLHHQVAHQVTVDAGRGGCPAHRLPIAAVQREGHPHPLGVVAADLETVRAPAPVALRHGDRAVVRPRVNRWAGVTGQQPSGLAHHAVDALVVQRRPTAAAALPVHQRAGAPIAVAGSGSITARSSAFNSASSRGRRPRRRSVQSAARCARTCTLLRATPRTRHTVFIGRPRAARVAAQSTFVRAPPPRPPSGFRSPASSCPAGAAARGSGGALHPVPWRNHGFARTHGGQGAVALKLAPVKDLIRVHAVLARH